MKRSSKTKNLERITVDRKIIEGLISGHPLTHLTESTGKSKGYLIKNRDLRLEHGYIVATSLATSRKANIFIRGQKEIDRKSVVQGKSVQQGVDIGGRRIIKKIFFQAEDGIRDGDE